MATGLQLTIFHRLRFIKTTLAIGMIFSVLCCVNLWAGQRWMPTAPVFAGLYIPPPYDYLLLVLEIVLMIVLIFSTKTRLVLFFILLLNFSFVMLDQNRLQPWFYLYNCFFLVLFFYNWRIDNINNYHSFFVILRLCISAVYIYSGLQKLNPNFVSDTYSWFIQPLANMVSERQMNFLVNTGYFIPYLEIAIGLGLLIKSFRFIAITLVIILHLTILILMGPFGNNYNAVVWPWNIIMVVLVLLLFSGDPMERRFSFVHLFKIPVFYLVAALFWILPAFNLRNHWETYLSFSLYSGNNHNAKILLSNKAYAGLPPYVKHYVYRENDQYMLYPKLWCLNELKVPLYPERRIFERVTREVRVLTNSGEDDVKLIYIEKLKIFDAQP